MFLRIAIAFILIYISSFASAQEMLRNKSILNYQRGDRMFIHFGFTLGTNFMDYRAELADQTSLGVEGGKINTGFHVGIISELRITRDLGLRLMPGLEFSSRRLIYTGVPDVPDNIQESVIDNIYISVPLMLKYKAKRINNYRPFITAGPSVKYDFLNHSTIKPDRNTYIRTKPVDVFVELGLGSDFYLPYFKFGIELRFSLGLLDILNHEYDTKNPGFEMYTDAIKSLKARMFTLCFHFE